MAKVLRMPGVAANTTEAVLAEWLVEESGEFDTGGALATVETEKALVDVEADAAGVVLKTLVPPGSQVAVGDPIALLGEPGEQVDDVEALLAELGVSAPEVSVPERRDVPTDPESAAPLAETPRPEVEHRAPAPNGRVWASPLARRLARDAGIPLESINGSGPRGRILKRDVHAATVDPPESFGRVSAGTPAYQEIPHSRLRKFAADRLAQSKQQAPHFYVRATVRAEALEALRAEINEGTESRVSLNDLVVKAVGAAHRRVPELNVTWTDDAVRQFETADIGVAVATDRGLLTPVVRDVGSLTVTALAAQVRDLATRARDGKLRQDELEGGTIAVTNLGMYGVEEFAAIINPPHAAILAVGAVRDEPVVDSGAVVPGRLMSVTLSVDHRPADGVVAARWLAALVELLEHPARALA